MADRRGYALAVAAVLAVGVAARTLPMWRSPLPFNPDGIHAARLAAAALAAGRLPLARMATDDLLFPPLLATASAVTGVPALRVGQPTAAVVGATTAVLGVAVVRRVAGGRGWSPRRVHRAALLAGLLLAVEGLYLHRSMATDEQTVGLLLVPLAAVAVHRAGRTGRRAWWVAAAPALVALGPTHNLDATVMALTLAVLAAVALARRPVASAWPAVALAAGYAASLAGYHLLVARLTPARIIQDYFLTDVPGLVVAWLVLAAVETPWLLGRRPRTQRALALAPFGVGFALLGLNAAVPVFPGTPATPAPLLAGLAPLALVAALAGWELPVANRLDRDGRPLFALVAAATTLALLALTAALTADYLALAYRASTFLHFPVLALAGVGTVRVAARLSGRLSGRRAAVARGALAAAVLVAAVASVPVALGGLAVLNYKGVTTPAELSAAEFAADHAAGPWAADDHLARIAPRTRAPGSVRPVYGWLHGGPAPACPTVAQRSWTTTGAQLFPAPPARLDPPSFETWQRTRSVVYRSGARDPILVTAGRGGTGC